jgi:hypothetical protein
VLVVLFIAVATVSYLAVGTAPARLLVFAGAFNGFAVAVGDRRASVGGVTACGPAARAPVSAVAALSGWGGVYLAVRSFAGLL